MFDFLRKILFGILAVLCFYFSWTLFFNALHGWWFFLTVMSPFLFVAGFFFLFWFLLPSKNSVIRHLLRSGYVRLVDVHVSSVEVERRTPSCYFRDTKVAIRGGGQMIDVYLSEADEVSCPGYRRYDFPTLTLLSEGKSFIAFKKTY